MTQSTDIALGTSLTGTQQRTEINSILQAFMTNHAGASRPSYAVPNSLWVQDTGGTSVTWYFYDGTDDISVGVFNKSANTFTPTGQLATFANAVVAKTGAFTLASADYGKVFTCDATAAAFTAAVAAGSSLPAGWFVILQKTDATANAVTLDPNASETINGATTYPLSRQGDSCILVRESSTTFVAIALPNTANLAPLASPALTGTPTAPTPTGGDNTTKIATTAFVAAAVAAAVSTLATLASPNFTGAPTAPTPTAGDNSTKLATTAYVVAAIAAIPSGITSVVAGAGMSVSTASGVATVGVNTNNFGGVGELAMVTMPSGTAAGATFTTGNFVSFARSNTGGFTSQDGPAISGTWRNLGALGFTNGSGGPVASITLARRIS